jgi:hypothetical protein
MSTAAASRVALDGPGPALRTRVAAVVVVLALAGLAAYAMVSGPTIAPVPSNGPAKTAPSKGAPPAEDQSPEGPEGGDGG